MTLRDTGSLSYSTEVLGYASAGGYPQPGTKPVVRHNPSVPAPALLPPQPKARRGVGAKGATRKAAADVRRPLPDAQLAAQMLACYTPLVRQIAGGFQRKLPRNVLREDLVAAGMSGLWDAIRRHADKPGDGFEWYVRVRIRGAILDELRAQDWLPRRARAAASEARQNAQGTGQSAPPSVVRFDDVSEWEQNRCLSTSDTFSSEASVEAKFTRESLVRAVEQLPERERHIVSEHYFRGVKFKDLGAELGVSEPRISQLHSRAMQRLKLIMSDAA